MANVISASPTGIAINVCRVVQNIPDILHHDSSMKSHWNFLIRFTTTSQVTDVAAHYNMSHYTAHW